MCNLVGLIEQKIQSLLLQTDYSCLLILPLACRDMIGLKSSILNSHWKFIIDMSKVMHRSFNKQGAVKVDQTASKAIMCQRKTFFFWIKKNCVIMLPKITIPIDYIIFGNVR